MFPTGQCWPPKPAGQQRLGIRMRMSQDQQIFSNAVLSPRAAVPNGLHEGRGKAANRRFSIYRNNVMDSLIKALQTGFPVIAKLLGEQSFENIASGFVRQYPPKSAVISQYGDLLPAFLKGFKPLDHLPYLGDTARLELALRQSYHAADNSAIQPSELDTLSPDQLNSAPLAAGPLRLRDPLCLVYIRHLAL